MKRYVLAACSFVRQFFRAPDEARTVPGVFLPDPPLPSSYVPSPFSNPLNAHGPLAFFFRVQQASMDGNRAVLDNLCERFLAEALAALPEPGRSALATLKNVTFDLRDTMDDMTVVRYRFRDTAEDRVVTQDWVFGADLSGRGAPLRLQCIIDVEGVA